MNDISLEDLRSDIETAFANVEPPDPDNIIEHDCPECRAVRRVFRHEQWRSIKPNKVEWGHDKLSYFTPQAFQYFLPAFMIYSLEEPSSILCEFLVYSLTWGSDLLQKRLDRLSLNQKAACRLFLRWIQFRPECESDPEEIERAIAEWWQIESG